MSKSVKKVAKVVAVGALVASGFGAVAALSAGFAVGAATIGGFSLLTIAKVGLVAASIGFLGPKKPSFQSARQMAENLSIFGNPSAARQVVFGRAGIAGQVLFRKNVDNSNQEDTPDELLIILGLSGYPCTAIEKFWLNNELIWSGDSTTGPGEITSGKYANELFLYFRTGEETSDAFPAIASLSSEWNAKTRKLRGIAAVAIRLKVTEKLEGRFEPLFQVKGAKLYDPRLDTTAGGSGSHRFDDQTTFEWSENPKLAELMYLRGGTVNGVRVFGMGIPEDRINMDSFAAEASVCEEQIDVKAGGSIDRYTCNGVMNPAQSHRENLSALLSASAGSMDVSDGTYHTFAGAWRTPVMTLDESDIEGAPADMRLELDPSEEINVIRGSFAYPESQWQVVEYPERRDTVSIGKFGERSLPLDLPFTTDHRIAQRITKIEMLRATAQRTMTANYWIRAAELQPGDIVNQTYTRYGFSSTTMKVVLWAMEQGLSAGGIPRLNVVMQLVEEREEWFDWDEETEEADLATGVPGLMPAGISTPRLDTMLGTVDKIRITRDVSGQNLLGSNAASEISGAGLFPSSQTYSMATLGLAVGDVISLGADIRHSAGDRVRIRFQFRDAGNNPKGLVQGTNITPTDYTRQSVTATIPANSVAFQIELINADATASAFWRRRMLNLGPSALPFEEPPTRVNRGEVEEGADVTADNPQAPDWLTALVDAGHIDASSVEAVLDAINMVNGPAEADADPTATNPQAPSWLTALIASGDIDAASVEAVLDALNMVNGPAEANSTKGVIEAVGSSTSSQQNITNVWTTVEEDTITVEAGEDVLVTVGMMYALEAHTQVLAGSIRVLRGATTVVSEINVILNIGWFEAFSLPIFESPGAGTHTYKLQCKGPLSKDMIVKEAVIVAQAVR
jgi:hypothetical protein